MFPLGKISAISFLVVASFIFISCSDSISVSNGPITVHGTVVDANGFNFSSAKVNINDGIPVNVNADGSFSFPNINPPYRIAVYSSLDSGITVYDGLTNANPVLSSESVTNQYSVNTATVQISYPVQPGGKQVAGRILTNRTATVCTTYVHTDSTMMFSIRWPSANQVIQANLAFLIFSTSSGGGAFSFDNFAYKPITLSNNSYQSISFSAQDLYFVPGESFVTVTTPAQAGNTDILASIVFPESLQNSQIDFFYWSFNGSRQIKVPESLSLPFMIKVQASAFAQNGFTTACISPGSEVSLQYTSPVTLQTPQNDTVGVGDHTTFSYSDGINSNVYVSSVFGVYPYRFKLKYITAGRQFTFPKIYMFGSSLDTNKSVGWNVLKVTGYQNIDAYASWQRYQSSSNVIQKTGSDTRYFTTWH